MCGNQGFHAAAAQHAALGFAQGHQEDRQGRQKPLHLHGGARRQAFIGSLVDWQCPVQRFFLPPCSRTAMCLTLMVQADFIFEVAQADASPDTPMEY